MNHLPPPNVSRFAPVPTTGALAAVFALIVKGFCDSIAGRAGRREVPGPLAALLISRLHRLADRIERLTAKFRAGTLRPPRPRGSRRRLAPPQPPPAGPAAPRLSRKFGWLGQLVPEARSQASQLEHWLAQPEVAELLKTAPQAARLLRPLCHISGIRPDPALLPPLPARRRKSPPASPKTGAKTGPKDDPKNPRREPAEARREEARWAAAFRRSLGLRRRE